jgi:hypothetical protein
MSITRRSLLLMVAHIALLQLLTARYLYDRLTLPRAWARTVPVDPEHPIRGRYVSLGLMVEAAEGLPAGSHQRLPVALEAREGRLVAVPVRSRSDLHLRSTPGMRGYQLVRPVAFFIPEHAADPSIRPGGEELWVEVQVPRRGMPRPVRLGVKREDEPMDRIQPLPLQ